MENKRVKSSGYLWWGGRLIWINAAQVASGQGQCGFGSDSHVVNRAATYLPITGPSLEDWTRICNIHSQQANKVCVCVCLCVQGCVSMWRESFASTVLLTSRVRQFEVPSSSMSGDGVADLAEPSSSITPQVSPNQNRHIVCLSVHSAAMLASKFALLPQIAFRTAGWRTKTGLHNVKVKLWIAILCVKASRGALMLKIQMEGAHFA